MLLIVGDFNDTRYAWERSGFYAQTSRRTARFNEWVEDMELLEIESAGASHTWVSGLTPETHYSARLNRALCNWDWGLRFSNAKVKHLPSIAQTIVHFLSLQIGFLLFNP